MDSQLLGYQWLIQPDLRTESIDLKVPLFELIEIYSEHVGWALIHHISSTIMIRKFT